MAYSPTFNRNPKGNKYIDNGSFISVIGGSDAYLLEDEFNESQWNQVSQKAKELHTLFGNGYVLKHKNGTKWYNYTTTTQNNITTTTITFNDFIVLLQGYVFEIPSQSFTVTYDSSTETETSTNYKALILDTCFKVIKDSDTTIIEYGDCNKNNVINYSTIDTQRVGSPTSRRIQKQFYIKLSTSTTDLFNIDWRDVDSWTEYYKDNSYFGTGVIDCTDNSANSFEDGTFGYRISNDDIVPMSCSGTNTDTQDIILSIPLLLFNNGIPEMDILPKLKLYSDIDKIVTLQNEITTLTTTLANLNARVDDIDERTGSYYQKYGFYMSNKTSVYAGNNNKKDIELNSPEYTVQSTDTELYYITNIGNMYSGQIGEVWLKQQSPVNKVLSIYNTGKSNVMFQLTSFFKGNDSSVIAYSDDKVFNSTNGVALNFGSDFKNGNSVVDIRQWNDVVYFVIPYGSTSCPNTGTIWIDDSENYRITVYNSGSTSGHFICFAISATHSNLQLDDIDFWNEGNIVTDAFGTHHLVTNDVSAKFVVLSTILKEGNTVPSLGEVYLLNGVNQYQVTTTDVDRNARMNALVFK